MQNVPSPGQDLVAENAALRTRLSEVEETLRAIRTGEVDGIIIETPDGPQIYILQSADAESNRFRSDILGKVSDAVVAVDEDQHVIYLNAAAERQYGIRASDALGRGLAEVFETRWFQDGDEQDAAESLKVKGQWRGKSIQIQRDGKVIHVESSISRLHRRDGTPAGMLSVIRDITSQSAAEEALRESELRFRTLFNSIDEGFCVIEMIFNEMGRPVDYRFLQVSPSFEAQTGLANATGRTMREMVPDHEDHWFETYGKVARTGEGIRFQQKAAALGRYYDIFASPFGPRERFQVAVLFSDVSERIRAEQALRENQARLKFTLEAAQIGEWDLDLATERTRRSLRHDQVFGYPSGAPDWGLDSFMQHVHPEDQSRIQQLFLEAIRERKDWNAECRIVWPDHSVHWVSSQGSLFFGPEGKPERLVGIVMDITRRKETEAALRHNEALFGTIINQALGGVYVVDANLQIIQVNARARPTFQAVEPIIGRSFPEVMEILWGRETGQEITRIFRHTLQTGERYVAPEFDAFREDLREERSYEWEVQRLTLPQGGYGLVCYFTDVTEQRILQIALKESERRAGDIIQSITDGFITMDAEWRITYLSARGAEILAPLQKTTSNVLGKVFWEEFPHAVGKDIDLNCRKSLGEQVPVQFETYYTPLERWFDLRVYPSPGGLSLFFLDITERKKAEEGLRASQKVLADQADALRTADRSKDEFLAMLAHELRNPLSPLRNASEILRIADPASGEREQAQRIIDRQIENMSRMIEDLLDVSRINEGKIELRCQAVSLELILVAVANAARPNCAARGQQFHLRLPEEPVWLHADPTRLEQIFGNLVGNAIKYSGEGCRISILAEVNRGVSPPELVVRVVDNGSGIDPLLLPRIFELFVQASRTLDRAHGGLGIGLTLVQRLVRLHGGAIEARSGGPGQGAEFLVHLPILSEAPMPAPVTAPVPLQAGESRRILIVDDNVDSARSLATLQERRGHQTQTVFTGPDAITACLSFQPEVVLLDIGLPGMDGFEVARRIRSTNSLQGCLIIAMSGYGREEDRAAARAAGFDHYLVKPLDLRLLRDWIGRHPAAEPVHSSRHQ